MAGSALNLTAPAGALDAMLLLQPTRLLLTVAIPTLVANLKVLLKNSRRLLDIIFKS